jgi:hypothetical protein
MTSLQPICEIRPRKDWHGFALVGNRVPLGELRFEGPDAIVDAVNYAKFSRARIRGSFACLMNPGLWSGRPIQRALASSNSFFA